MSCVAAYLAAGAYHDLSSQGSPQGSILIHRAVGGTIPLKQQFMSNEPGQILIRSWP